MIWPTADRWRAPVDDFPPRWASAWGDDVYGLWADLEVGGATQRMRWIEPSGPGGFWMGSPGKEREAITYDALRDHADRTEHEPRRVVVLEGFWFADGPCTQTFWMAVMQGANPSHFVYQPDSPQCPVENVSWDEVQGFLADLERLCPALAGRAALPTEVQWEYAARADTVTAYPWGDEPDDARANWGAQQRGSTPVGRSEPNAWGLHDMHGNVWHWCADVWRGRLDESSPLDLSGPTMRVVRGGTWAVHPGGARSAFRNGWLPEDRLGLLGFRIALRSSSPVKAR